MRQKSKVLYPLKVKKKEEYSILGCPDGGGRLMIIGFKAGSPILLLVAPDWLPGIHRFALVLILKIRDSRSAVRGLITIQLEA